MTTWTHFSLFQTGATLSGRGFWRSTDGATWQKTASLEAATVISGTATSVGLNFLTDTSKTWVVNAYQSGAGVAWWLIDSAGTIFLISSNTKDTLTVVGTPAAGAYRLGRVICYAEANWTSVVGLASTTDGSNTAIFITYNLWLYRSLDAGDTWEIAIAPTAGHGGSHSVACDPRTPGKVCVIGITKSAVSTSGLLAGTMTTTWTLGTAYPDSIHPGNDNAHWDSTGRIYVCTTEGVLLSGDGRTWEKIRHILNVADRIEQVYSPPYPSESSPLWASRATGLYRCQMDGTKWTGLFEGESGGDPMGDVVPTGTPTNYIPAAANTSPSSNGLVNVYGFAFTATKLVVCGPHVASHPIWTTPISNIASGSPTWTAATITDGAGITWANLYTSPTTSSTLYTMSYTLVAGKGGIWKSVDNGVTWAKSNTNQEGATVTFLFNIVPIAAPARFGYGPWTTPTLPTDRTRKFSMCFDMGGKAWHYWRESEISGHYYDPVNKVMRAWGPLQGGHVHVRGGAVAPEIYFQLVGFANADRLKRFRHVEVDLTSDVSDWTCEFVIDGVTSRAVTKSVTNRGWWRYGAAIGNLIATYGPNVPTSTPPESVAVPTTAVNTTTETFTIVGHQFFDGQPLVYNNGGGASITNLTSGTTYYVVGTSGNTFKVSASLGGAPVNLGSTGNNAQTLTVSAAYGMPRRQTLRFPCPTGGRGRVMGFVLKSSSFAGFLRIHTVTPNTAEV